MTGTRRIVVGVDGSEGSAAALRWAVRDARSDGATVVALLAWNYLDQRTLEGFDPSYGEEEARAALARAVIDALGEGAQVEHRVVCDLPSRALVDASAGADLLVVGARGIGGFRGLLLGSVSQQCVHHAACPVVVVPPSDRWHPAPG